MKSKNKIAWRLLISILLFSGIVTICITAIQLYTEYNRDFNNIEGQFNKIEKIFKPALAQALWFFNEESIKVQLEGVSHLTDIEYIELISEENKSLIIGKKQSKHTLTRHIPLVYNSKGKEIEVGTLTVVASITKIYKRLFERLIIILLSQGVKTFLISIFIFLLVYFLVTKHLGTIDTYLKKMNLSTSPSLLELQRSFSHQGDELDQMVVSINEMTETIYRSYEEIEQKVQERTSELNYSNEQLKHEIKERKQAEEQIKSSLKEKEVLLSEIHHRVKNNMQVIISLLRLQADKIEDKKYADIFKEGEDRIRSMSLIHEQLYMSKDFANIDFGEYVKSFVNSLFVTYGVDTNKVKLNIEIKDVLFDLENAIPCGLIINELVSNSLKHAFPQQREGNISIALQSTNEDDLELTVSDDGVGIPEDLDIRDAESMGLHLVKVLSEQTLEGKMELNRTEGTRFHLLLKRAKYKPRI